MKSRLKLTLAVLTCALFTSTAAALSLFGDNKEPELLAPEVAFQTQASATDEGQLSVQINIAEGYYVYKNKISVKSEHASFAELQLPAGIRKQDEFFGEVETYRNGVGFNTGLSNHTSRTTIPISVTSQGCADRGICYPPFTQEFMVEVAAGSPLLADSGPALKQLTPLIPAIATNNEPVMNDPTLAPPLKSLGGLRSSISQSAQSNPLQSSNIDAPSSGLSSLRLNQDDEILDPQVAFTVTNQAARNGAVPITWNIREGYYLYGPKFSFEVVQPSGLPVQHTQISEGKVKNDEFFGEVEVHRNQANALIVFNNTTPINNLTLKVGYQGCADAGICYPPQSKEITIAMIPAVAPALASNSAAITANGDASLQTPGVAEQDRLAASVGGGDGLTNILTSVVGNTGDASVETQNVAEQDRLAASLGSGKRLTTILTFFGLGVLLAFTPCVLPMIPILSSIIVGSSDDGQGIGTRRAFGLSLVYVLAMALTYTVAGVIIGLTGENIQATLQHPYVLYTFALLFVVLAASMFGLFELQMPAFVQNRLTAVSNKQKSGSLAGVATMGFLSALIVGPCVTAPLVGALIYIGQTGDAVLGGAALFALSMGMGLPILIIGTSFGKYLPTAGPWMDTVKAVFGVMLLGLAIWMLDRAAPDWVIMLLTALLMIVVGMFMGALDGTRGSGLQRIAKGFGFASIVYGTLLMIGIATGSGTVLRPLQGLVTGATNASTTNNGHVEFEQIKGVAELEAALLTAKTQNKPVILDFYADWCVSCKEMEAFTFSDAQVAQRMSQAVLLQADVTANDKADKELLKRYGIFGPPAIILYNNTGAEVQGARVVGYMPAEKFNRHLQRFL